MTRNTKHNKGACEACFQSDHAYSEKNVTLYAICSNDSFWHEFCSIKETVQNYVKSRVKSTIYETVHLHGSSCGISAEIYGQLQLPVSCLSISCLLMIQLTGN